MTPEKLIQLCKEQDILIGQSGPKHFRFVLHYWIGNEDVEKSISIIKKAMVL
jgi:threonine aldolase